MAQEQIHTLGERWAEAERSGDIATLETLLAADFVAVGPRGFVLDRQQWLDRYRSGSLRNEDFSWQRDTLREYGETAVAVGALAQRSSFQGHDASGRFRLTQIAARQDGQWRIVGLQLSGPLPDQPTGRG